MTTSSHRILVIDDAAMVRAYHRRLLVAAGWTVQEAGNGVEGLEQVQAQADTDAFDLYVVDINMPKMDGYRFVHALRGLAVRHQAPVVMVSTEAQLQDLRAALDAGANAYLIKPARPAALVLIAALLMGDRPTALAAARQTAEEQA